MDHGYFRTLALLEILEPLNDRLILQTKSTLEYFKTLERLQILQFPKGSSRTLENLEILEAPKDLTYFSNLSNFRCFSDFRTPEGIV